MSVHPIELEINEKDMGSVQPLVGDNHLVIADAKLISGTWTTATIEVVYKLSETATWRALATPISLSSGTPFVSVPVAIAGMYKIGARVSLVEGAAGRVVVWLSMFRAP